MSIFVTWHSHENKRFAHKLADFLSSIFDNSSILFSSSEGSVSKKWVQENRQAIKESKFGIICLNQAVDSEKVQLYIDHIIAAKAKLFVILLDPNQQSPYNKNVSGILNILDKNELKTFIEIVNSNLEFPIRKIDLEYSFATFYPSLQNLYQLIIDEKLNHKASSAPMKLYFDLNEYSSEEIAAGISFLSELYRSIGGDKLIFDDMKISSLSSVNKPLIIV